MATTDSILDTVKKAIDGMDPEITDFDDELIIHINSMLRILHQLGVGKPGFSIEDRSATWTEFLGDQEADVAGMVPQYVALKIKMFWDPPTTGAASSALEKIVQELEWRLNVQVDPGQFP